MEGCTGDAGTPPVEAILETRGSLAAGSGELVGLTTDEGTPPVEAMTCVADTDGDTIDEGTPPVDPTEGGSSWLGLGDTGGRTSLLELTDSIGLGAVVVGSTGDSGTPPVEPTEGVEGSCTGVSIGLGEGEGVGLITGTGIAPVDPTLETNGNPWLEADGAGFSVGTAEEVGRTGSEGTPCVEPTSVFGEDSVSAGSDAASPGLETGDGETTIVSAFSVDEGRRCHSDSKKEDRFEEESSDDRD